MDEKQQTGEPRHTLLYYLKYIFSLTACPLKEIQGHYGCGSSPGSIALHEVGFYAVPKSLLWVVFESRGLFRTQRSIGAVTGIASFRVSEEGENMQVSEEDQIPVQV